MVAKSLRIAEAFPAAFLLPVVLLALGGCYEKESPVGPGSAVVPAAGHDPTQMLPVGSAAPGFTLLDEKGNPVSLADYAGKKNVVLVFYVGDNTPGCTTQLCVVRDDWSAFQSKDVAVFGVNPANAASHQEFVDNYHFPFPLLVDRDEKVTREYGCAGAAHVRRTVYGINKEGTIVFAQRGMPTTHEILSAFQ